MAKNKETMKFKYTGIYAPESNWVEHLYHESVEVKNGVAETSSQTTADTLLELGFVPYEKWEKEESKRQEEARASQAEREEAMRDKAEAIRKNAEKTAASEEKLTAKERKARDKEAAEVEGVKPLFPIEEQESSVSIGPAQEGAESAPAQE